jgi:hypothetical protein
MGFKRKDLAVRVDIEVAKGYTMKEIFGLEQRIKALEYYSVLNALALDTKTLSLPSTVPGAGGVERFKNGIFADPFNDGTIARTNDPEFSMAISSSKSIARPNFTETYNDMIVDTSTSTAVKIYGRLLMLDYTSVKIGGNDKATEYRNPAETFYNFRGALHLYPNYDGTNTNKEMAPQTITIDQAKAFQDAAANGAFKDIDTTYSAPKLDKEEGRTNYWSMDAKTTITDIKVTTQTTKQDLGNVVRDVAMLPYMKGRKVGIIGRFLRPGSKLYAYFDRKPVGTYCTTAKIANSFLKVDGTTDIDKFNASFAGDPAAAFVATSNTGGPFVANKYGEIAMIFNLPDNTFRSGERSFMLSNLDSLETGGEAITSAEGVYTSQGLSVTSQDVNFKIIEPIFTPKSNTYSPPPLTWTTQDPPPPPAPPPPSYCCFDPEALVVMYDGNKKKICEIEVGDKVKSGLDNNAYNNVIGIESPVIGDRKMYSFNNNWAFVSEEHPIMTDNGWGAFDPNSWAVEDNFKDKLTKIEIGSKVQRYIAGDDGIFESVDTIDSITKPEDYVIYNLMLDGDNTYIVENYVVHNKDGYTPDPCGGYLGDPARDTANDHAQNGLFG